MGFSNWLVADISKLHINEPGPPSLRPMITNRSNQSSLLLALNSYYELEQAAESMAFPARRSTWALLIGIDFYIPGNARKDEHGRTIHYPSLSGCVNDVQLVRNFLVHLGVPEDYITILTATNPSGQSYAATSASRTQSLGVTREMILSAMEKVTESAQSGDSVYIHYSGHGGRAQTVYSDVKGRNAYDEALVPSNIEISGGKYVRDVEIAFLLQRMVKKKLLVTVAIDSCHSGGATRSDGEVATRGIGRVDGAVLDSDRMGLLDIGSDYQLHEATRDAGGRQSWLLDPRGYIYLAACLVRESAHEVCLGPGRVHGVFTYCLIEALRAGSGEVTAELIHGHVCALVHSYFFNQTPNVEGEPHRMFFGHGNGCRRNPVRVTAVERATERITLDAGYLHGVSGGEEYAVYPANSDTSSSIATVRVREVREVVSTANLIGKGSGGWGSIIVGCEAVLTKSSAREQVLVRVIPNQMVEHNDELNRGIWNIKNLAKQKDYATLPWQLSSSDEDTISFIIRTNHRLEYELRDSANSILPRLPTIPVSEPHAAAIVGDYITHITRYRRVKQLTASPLAPLWLTHFELVRVGEHPVSPPKMPSVRSDADEDLGLSKPRRKGGLYQVRDGEHVGIRFRNSTSNPVYLTVFDLTPSWEITQIYPSGAGLSEEVLPDQERMLQFQMTIPPGSQSNTEKNRFIDHLKAIVTFKPTSLKSLEQDSIALGRTRRLQERSSETELGRLLDEFAISSRNARSSDTTIWHTHEIIIEVVPRFSCQEGADTGEIGPRILSTAGTDPDDRLAQYLEWYKGEAPHQKESLDAALVALQREGHDLGTLREMRDSDWSRLGIGLGLGGRLVRDIAAFEGL